MRYFAIISGKCGIYATVDPCNLLKTLNNSDRARAAPPKSLFLLAF